jgi:hypothetical protein
LGAKILNNLETNIYDRAIVLYFVSNYVEGGDL